MLGLTATQRHRFDREGYLVVDGVLDPIRDIRPVFAEYDRLLDEIAESLCAEGARRSSYRELPFTDRLIRVFVESGRNFTPYFDISLPQTGIRPDSPIHVGPAVFALMTNTRLLDILESILGPEIYSNPVQHIRMKLPSRAAATQGFNGLVSQIPWHQDNGQVLPEADESEILTVWMPLNDATVRNGCLQVIPGSHRAGVEPHCPTHKGSFIPDRLVPTERARPLPMRAGSILLMTRRTLHASLDNATKDQVRLSLDLRYQPTGQPTGRPFFPGFVARSAARPGSVLRDPEAWAQSWYDARARLADRERPSFNRWSADAPVCA